MYTQKSNLFLYRSPASPDSGVMSSPDEYISISIWAVCCIIRKTETLYHVLVMNNDTFSIWFCWMFEMLRIGFSVAPLGLLQCKVLKGGAFRNKPGFS